MNSNIIKNIYYMLSYTFSNLQTKRFKSLETEQFKNTSDLFAEILIISTSHLIKKGLYKEYINLTEELSNIKGKINISKSLTYKNRIKRQLLCSYDEYSENNLFNQIIKTTLLYLLNAEINPERKKKLKSILKYFSSVNSINIKEIDWDINYNRQNKHYEFLIAISYLVINGLIQIDTNGNTKLLEIMDDQELHHLYEKFVLNYYKKEFPELNVSSPFIPWMSQNNNFSFLPRMKTDIVLSYKENILIIDTKFYSKILSNHFGSKKIHSGNLYQIFTYVKNMEFQYPNKNINGMLLYAKWFQEENLNLNYDMDKNIIFIKTLDLNDPFISIKENLNNIVYHNLLNE